MARAREDFDKMKEEAELSARTYFTGHLKNLFIRDLEKGYKQAELLREMAKAYYEQKERQAKHSY
jgi:uncharacterized GH25 family protein